MPSPYEPVAAVLSVPENRIKYCYEWMRTHPDPQMRTLALQRACEWIAVAVDEESHY